MTGHRTSKLWIGLWAALALAGCGSDGGDDGPDGPNLEEFQVNTSAISDGGAEGARVSPGADNRFMVVWSSSDNILAQRIDANGRKDGTEISVARAANTSNCAPCVVQGASVGIAPQGQAIFAFIRQVDPAEGAVFARRYQSDGTPAGEEFRVGAESFVSGSAPLVGVSSTGASVIVWSTLRGAGHQSSSVNVKGQRLGADGAKAGSEFLVANFRRDSSSQYAINPSLSVAPDGTFLVTWYGPAGNRRGQRYGSDGSKIGAEFDLGRLPAGGVSVGMRPDGSFVSVYGRDGHVFLQRFSIDGSRIGGELQVDTTAGIAVGGALSMASDGKFALSWAHFPSTTASKDSIQVQRFAADASRIGSEFRAVDATADPGNVGISDLALSPNGHLLVTWFTRSSLRARLFAE